jgi:hypothetical protein
MSLLDSKMPDYGDSVTFKDIGVGKAISISPLSTSSANLDITSIPSGAPIEIILPLKSVSLDLSTLYKKSESLTLSSLSFARLIEASYIKTDAPDEVNSITKLTILQAMRDGDFSPENLESNFNTLMGDAQNCSVCWRIVALFLSHLV